MKSWLIEVIDSVFLLLESRGDGWSIVYLVFWCGSSSDEEVGVGYM